jgi:hypothetical protein
VSCSVTASPTQSKEEQHHKVTEIMDTEWDDSVFDNGMESAGRRLASPAHIKKFVITTNS